jgi:hypothetical protein
MKLPRYKDSASSNVVASNRSLTTGVSEGGAIADIGALALSKVAEYGAIKNKHEEKLRRLDINTNKSLSDSMMFGKTSEFENSLMNREDFLTPDNWLLDYDTQAKGWEKEFKIGLDEQTWTEYQPLYYQKFFESRNKVVTAINNQKLKNAGHAFNESLNTYNKTLENATSLREIETAYELYTEIHLANNVKTNLFDTDKFNKVKDETKQYTNVKYSMFQATEGLNIQSPNGSKEIDWNSVTSRLKNKNFSMVDIEGNEITVDDDLRQTLIKEATELFNTQNGLHTKQKEENDKTDKKDFTNRIISLETGSKEGAEGAKNFMADLEKSNLEPSMKLTLRTAYNASLNNMKNGKNSWNSVQGKQALSLVTYMVGSGAMDTEAERQVIFDLMANGLLKPETALSLYDKSISLTKNRNLFKKDLTTRAISMLMKEIGAGEGILSLLDNIQNVPAEERTAMLTQALSSGRMTKEAYNAMNNMFSLLAQGERKGFTYENMLVNQRHPNYILNDLISTYKGSMNDARLQELQTRIDGIQGTTATDKTFYIMPTEYFTKKTPSNANMVVPQRLEGEGVLEYVKRAKKLIKRNDNLPSVITGDNIETLDISDLFIMPDFE